MKSMGEIKAAAQLILGRGTLTASELECLEALANEFSSLRANKQKGERMKKIVAAPAKRGFFGHGRGESNFDAYGQIVDKKTSVRNLEDGIYIVKESICKKMKTSNGTGTVAVVYRVAKKAEAPAPAVKKAVKKTAEPEPVKKVVKKAAPAAEPVKKATPVKKAAGKGPSVEKQTDKGKGKGKDKPKPTGKNKGKK
jgi:hypothetical protein